MKKYIFEAPEDWDLKKCYIDVLEDTSEIRIEKPIDNFTSEVCRYKIIAMDEHPYYSTLHDRVAKCVKDLREHFNLGYITDPCGGIQALEITTRQLMSY
jgi:hypothetical protein